VDPKAASSIALRSGGALHVYGQAGAVPILFLHGLGGGAWSWKAQREALAGSFRLFLWEARGHGAAAHVGNAGLADYYVDAHEALAAVVDDGRRPAFIVGHSVGGLLAMALGCDVAAAVAGLFLIEPVYSTGREVLFRLLLPLGKVASPALAPLAESVIAKHVRRLFERQFENRVHMEQAWLDQREQVPFEYPQIFRDGIAGPQAFPLREFAKEITDPTFLIEGSTGRVRPRIPRLVTTLGERLGEDFTYESIPGGHYLQLDQPDVVNDRLTRFVNTYAGVRRERPS
jgi:3-oxoadipate enol-lactonase